MPEITNLPILTEATAETYLITVDNGIAKRLPLGGVGQIKGDIGYTGSTGITGYTGSVSTIPGYTGSRGYTGSTGYAGSRGAYDAIGFTGSQGYVGSRGPANMLNATAGTADTLEYFVGVSQPNAEVTPVISVNHSIVFNPGRGLVGIGTQTPSGTLHLKSAQTPELYFEQGTTSTQHKIYSTGGTFNIDIDTNNTRGGSYFYINQVGAKKITVDPRGFLGAGTSDPAEQLDVRGRIKVSSTSSLVGTDLSYGRFFAQQGGIPGIPNAFPGSGGNIFVENQVWTGASTTNPSYAGSLIVGTTKVDNGYTGVLDIWVTSTATAVSNQFNNWVQALEVQKKGVDVFRDLKVWGNLEVDGYYFRDGAAATSHITTFAPEMHIAEFTATTVILGLAATTLTMGASIDAPYNIATINNPTVRGANATQNLWDTVALTVNAFGAASTLNMGAGSGVATLRNPTLVGVNGTQNVYDTVANNVFAFGAATALNLGSGLPGVATIRNPVVRGVNLTQYLWDTTATTVYLAGEATRLNMGSPAHDSIALIRNPTVVGSSSTQYLWDTTATTIYFAGSATTLFVGSSTGIATVRNPVVVGVNTTQYLWDTVATTVNAFGTASTLNMGYSTGVATLRNPTLVGVNATQNVYDTVATTVNAFGTANTLNMGASTGIATLRNPTLVGVNAIQNVYDTVATTVNAFGTAATLNVGAPIGVATVRNPTVVGVNSTQYLWNDVATTVNAFGAATTLSMGANSGILTVGNPTVVGTQATQYLWDTTATTVYFAGSATSMFVGSTASNVTFRHDVTVNGSLHVIGGTTYSESTNTVFSDNLIEIHAKQADPTLPWTFDDNADIGFRIHYFNRQINSDANAALVLADDSQYLEFYNLGADILVDKQFSGTLYGTFKTGSIKLVHTTASNTTSTGALTVEGGVGIGGNLNAAGYGRFAGAYNETTSTVGVYSGLAGSGTPTPRIGFFNGTPIQNWQIDNFNGTLRWFTPLSSKMQLDLNGNLTVYSTTASTSVSTGALVIGGGAGIGGDLYVGGKIFDASLTPNRITYATTGGQLTDSANLTFNGSVLTATNTITGTISSIANHTTAELAEGPTGPYYFTNARARAALSMTVSGSAASYSTATGIINIPANISAFTNDSAYIKLTSLSAGTGVTYDNTTGQISIGQAVGSGNSPTFSGLTIYGAITATGDITAFYTSDARLKTNVTNITSAASKVSQLNGVTFNWNNAAVELGKSANVTEAGVIAQEVQQVLPEAVTERDNGYLAVHYEKLVPLLIEAIKEQQSTIDQLSSDMAALKAKLGFNI